MGSLPPTWVSFDLSPPPYTFAIVYSRPALTAGVCYDTDDRKHPLTYWVYMNKTERKEMELYTALSRLLNHEHSNVEQKQEHNNHEMLLCMCNTIEWVTDYFVTLGLAVFNCLNITLEQ